MQDKKVQLFNCSITNTLVQENGEENLKKTYDLRKRRKNNCLFFGQMGTLPAATPKPQSSSARFIYVGAVYGAIGDGQRLDEVGVL